MRTTIYCPPSIRSAQIAAPLIWMAMPLVALWPIWVWSAQRLTDGSDDPLGIIALIALLVVIVRDRQHLSSRPHPLWLGMGMVFAAVSALSALSLPWLLRGGLAIVSLICMLTALKGRRQNLLSQGGLGLLALPVLSSLQFFAGFPLRVITAQVSAWILGLLGIDAVRSGSSLMVAGQLIMVDAACSGIQMAWMAYFTACMTACWLRLPNRVFLRRLPMIGLIVMSGNVLRNTVLVAKESGLVDWPDWTHEGVGLVVFVLVCFLVLQQIARGTVVSLPSVHPHPVQLANPSSSSSKWLKISLMYFGVLALFPLALPVAPATSPSTPFVEWPREVAGKALRPLALSDVEEAFARQFPGAMTRMTDGSRIYTLRQVTVPTRKLHPAADCFRGLGYVIQSTQLEQHDLLGTSRQSLARCFVAVKDGQSLQICEQITDTKGKTFTDTSAWYWNALFNKTTGPWQAVTVITPLS